MASPLLNTPIEILRLIFASLSSADLHAICLTHKGFPIHAEPFLYSNIQWTWAESQTPPITQLLRSILSRPQRASFVQTVKLNGDTFQRNQHRFRHASPKIPVTESDLDGLIECIKRINVPYDDVWIQELRSGTMDAFVALLLSQLPNLRCLHLSENFTRESRFVGMILRSALCDEPRDSHLPSFKHLHDVSTIYFDLGIDIRRYTNARNTTEVLPFFYLPSIKRIEASIDNPTTFVWPAAHPPNSSLLASLELTMIREGHLGQVLSNARGLKELRWDWRYRPDLEDHFVTDIIDLDQIAEDLFHVRETLADLTITATSDLSRAEPQYPHLGINGRLSPFTNLDMLKRLEVPLPFLRGFSIFDSAVTCIEQTLPRNIEFVTITDDLRCQDEWEWQDDDLFDDIRGWLQDWRESTPHLRGIHLYFYVIDYGEWDPLMRQKLRDLGAEAGVLVEITKLQGSM